MMQAAFLLHTVVEQELLAIKLLLAALYRVYD